MFEIRVICTPADTGHVVAALDRAFTAGTVSVYPTKDGQQNRLYLRAEHREQPEPWPTPEEAYALAPNIISEIDWAARTVADAACFSELEREFYLRKAALLDRIALHGESDGFHDDAAETALEAALFLLDVDQPGVICDPRAYVRQQYARTLTHNQ
ncbi:hypothetical protein [Streptomyces sp. NPDC005485]|uniref:hypothetical protein n=1 Tax=Streptomyces sp. NPDC005485 TaxID=3155591 RepID=UPI0033A49434